MKEANIHLLVPSYLCRGQQTLLITADLLSATNVFSMKFLEVWQVTRGRHFALAYWPWVLPWLWYMVGVTIYVNVHACTMSMATPMQTGKRIPHTA